MPITITFTKNDTVTDFKQVGEYAVNVLIDTEEYYLNTNFNVVVNRYVQLTVDDRNVTYNGQTQGVKVSTDCTVNFDIVYTIDGNVVASASKE